MDYRLLWRFHGFLRLVFGGSLVVLCIFPVFFDDLKKAPEVASEKNHGSSN